MRFCLGRLRQRSGRRRAVFKIAEVGGQYDKKAKEEIQNLPNATIAKDQLQARWIYLFCEILRTAKLSDQKKEEAFNTVLKAANPQTSPPASGRNTVAPNVKQAQGTPFKKHEPTGQRNELSPSKDRSVTLTDRNQLNNSPIITGDNNRIEFNAGQKPTDPPDVALRFVYPKSPALEIINQSSAIARDIKWVVVLWNADLPDRNDPLPIPVQTFDWIRPNDKGGAQNLFGSPLVAPLLKPGNHLFGTASVSCPECARGRTYIVSIVWGEGGWVSELEHEKSGGLLIPKSNLEPGRMEFFKELEAATAIQSRIPIPDR